MVLTAEHTPTKSWDTTPPLSAARRGADAPLGGRTDLLAYIPASSLISPSMGLSSSSAFIR